MKRPDDIKHLDFHCWSVNYVPDHRHEEAGWCAMNSMIARDCVPSYRLPGGGIPESDLTDLPEAIDQSIVHLRQRINDCYDRIRELRKFRQTIVSEDAMTELVAQAQELDMGYEPDKENNDDQ